MSRPGVFSDNFRHFFIGHEFASLGFSQSGFDFSNLPLFASNIILDLLGCHIRARAIKRLRDLVEFTSRLV